MSGTEVLSATESGTLEIKYNNYTLMPKNPYDQMNKKLGITNVRMGSGAPICDIELNEMQELMQQQINCYDVIIRNMFDISNNADIVFISKSQAEIDNNNYVSIGGRMFACIKGKIIELKPGFYVSSMKTEDSKIYAIFTYDDMIKAIESQNDEGEIEYTQLYEYGYRGSFQNYESYRNDTRINESISIISAADYLYNYNADKNESIIDGAPFGTETSRRCGITYGIITSNSLPMVANNEIIIQIGEVKSGSVIFGGSNVIITSSIKNNLEHHVHKDEQIMLPVESWSGNNNDGFIQEVSLKNINLTDYGSQRPIISLIPVGENKSDKIQELDSYSCISEAQVNENTITFICYESKPIVDLTLNVKVV